MYALVLAGGKGERLRPYTDNRPKPMVEIRDRPILAYQIEWLQREGITDVILLCGYRHEVITDYFGNGEKWGLCIDYLTEDEPLGRGGAFKQGFERIPSNESLVVATNGDIITAQPLQPLVEAHQASGALATIMLTPFLSPYGIVNVADDNRIVGFEEKPQLPYWINAGVYVFSTDCCQYLPDRGDHEDSTFPELAKRGQLCAFKSRAFWKAIDTVKDISDATRELAEHPPSGSATQ